MKLNDGRYIVDTATSTLLAETGLQKEGGGYSYETHSIYRLWRSKQGKFFISRHYKEFICMSFLRGGPITGVKVFVYDDEKSAIDSWIRNGGEVPESMLIEA